MRPNREQMARRRLVWGGLGVMGIGSAIAVHWWLSEPQESAQHQMPTRVHSNATPESTAPVMQARASQEPRLSRTRTQSDPVFDDVETERAFWKRRLQGEQLTLQSRAESLRHLDVAVERAPSPELEQRRITLEKKHAEQSRRVNDIEQRLKTLDGAG